ncbi:hypothetical protein [Pseudomonas sp. USHLN015]|uniref:hypothetical protein n=1 Tax=Pseudomonas sp. USHLN015 TaxID=3081296 RepID=UPI00301BBC72
MNLVSLQVFGNGISGWRSELLGFGTKITQLYGPNGCGKTPLMQSIAFCLGYPCVFRQDIYDHCGYVVLVVSTARGFLRIKRVYNRSVDIEVTGDGIPLQRFYDEKDYSDFLFELLGLSIPKLVSVGNKLTQPYLAALLPLFYLDQDDGYNALYCPPDKFIKDQFSEMLRVLFRLPVKNSFEAKKERIRAKERLDFLDREVQLQRRLYDSAKTTTEYIKLSAVELNDQIKSLVDEIELLKSTSAGRDDSVSAFDRLIAHLRAEIREAITEIDTLNKRISGVSRISHEINTEIDTLTLNEESRRLFMSFSEICGSAACQLFSASSESYSKNLLYLRDQIKDLERNAEVDSQRLVQATERRLLLQQQMEAIIDERNKLFKSSEVSAVVEAISSLKERVFDLQLQKNELDKVSALEKVYVKAINERDKALEYLQSFSVETSNSVSIVEVRSGLRELYLEWLDTIHTVNISKDITFKDDFIPILGRESVSQLKGSTRFRAVLAYHAALIELMVKRGFLPFKFLILDTPKQHEIYDVDLDRYFNRLKKIGADYNFQVVFSSTEYHYALGAGDKEWTPKYPGEEQNMFLTAAG